MRYAALLTAAVLTLSVSACADDPNSLSAQAKAGDRKGYVSGDGSVEKIAAEKRQEPVELSGATVVTSVASSGVFVSCIARPLPASATNTWEAPRKFAMNATCVPDGDQTGEETVAPLGASMFFVAPDRGSTRRNPRSSLIVSVRARFASVST